MPWGHYPVPVSDLKPAPEHVCQSLRSHVLLSLASSEPRCAAELDPDQNFGSGSSRLPLFVQHFV